MGPFGVRALDCISAGLGRRMTSEAMCANLQIVRPLQLLSAADKSVGVLLSLGTTHGSLSPGPASGLQAFGSTTNLVAATFTMQQRRSGMPGAIGVPLHDPSKRDGGRGRPLLRYSPPGARRPQQWRQQPWPAASALRAVQRRKRGRGSRGGRWGAARAWWPTSASLRLLRWPSSLLEAMDCGSKTYER